MKNKSIVLLSGGLDSTVSFKCAIDKTDVLLALTFNYGQRAAQKEIESSEHICKAFGVPHKVITLDWLAEITATALVQTNKELPRPDVPPQESARLVWIPNRNAIFINVAAGFAESLNADLIVVGFNAEESQTFPDNSKEFVQAINRSLSFSTLKKPKVISYTQDLTKPKIVELGLKIGAPLSWIWSCYEGGEKHCYQCESCLRLQKALKANNRWAWFLKQRGRG